MGWKSTITIKREDAQKELLARVLTMDNESLALALEDAMGDRYGHNFMIVDQYDREKPKAERDPYGSPDYTGSL